MHRTTRELLAPPGDNGSLAVREDLRALPELSPPAGAWDRILAEHRRRQRARIAWRAAAAAAVVAVGVLLTAVGPRPPASPSTRAGAGSTERLRDLVVASRDLERVLRTPALQSPVLRPAEAARIVTLEDRIAAIDAELEFVGPGLVGDRAVVLWTDRVELLDQLVRERSGFAELGDTDWAVNRTDGREP